MEKTSYEFLEKFMKTHTPSGFESEGQLLWKERTKAFSEKVSSDVHGNMIASINRSAPTRIMLPDIVMKSVSWSRIFQKKGSSILPLSAASTRACWPASRPILTKDRIRGSSAKSHTHVGKGDRKKAVDIKDLSWTSGQRAGRRPKST